MLVVWIGGGRFIKKVGEALLERGGGGDLELLPPLLAGISLFVVSGVVFPLATVFILDASVPPAFSTLSPALSKSVCPLALLLLCLCSRPSVADLEFGK